MILQADAEDTLVGMLPLATSWIFDCCTIVVWKFLRMRVGCCESLFKKAQVLTFAKRGAVDPSTQTARMSSKVLLFILDQALMTQQLSAKRIIKSRLVH